MRICITGGAGFVGSHIADALGSRHQVTVIDNLLTGKRENLGTSTAFFEEDITDRESLYMIANAVRPEVVIHCAASYSDPDLWHRDTDTNVAGCINVAAVAKYHEAHLVYFQTILPPVSSYAISKIAGEQYLRLSGVPLTVFRLANIYGPRNLSGPIPVFYKRITSGQPCVVVDTTRDMLYIHDLVEGVVSAVERRTEGTFDMCSGEQVPIKRLFAAVAAVLDHEEDPPVIPPAPDDVQGTVSRRKGLRGWYPRTPLTHGIVDTVASYRDNGISETHTHLRIGAAANDTDAATG